MNSFPSKLLVTAHYSLLRPRNVPMQKRQFRGSSGTTKSAEIANINQKPQIIFQLAERRALSSSATASMNSSVFK